jgi:hypothetical protein
LCWCGRRRRRRRGCGRGGRFRCRRWRGCRGRAGRALDDDVRDAARVPVADLEAGDAARVKGERLDRPVGAVCYRHTGDLSAVRIVGSGKTGVAAVLVDENERLDADRAGKLVDLDAAPDAVIRVVHEAIVVLVDNVLRDDREVADIDFEVGVPGAGAVGVIDEELIRAALVGDGGDGDAGGRVLVAQDFAVGEACEIEERQAGAGLGSRCGCLVGMPGGGGAAAEGGEEEEYAGEEGYLGDEHSAHRCGAGPCGGR